MEPEERKQFVRAHRTCIFGYNRKNDGPSMSVTYYMTDDPDSIVVSTMAARGKAKAVARNPKVSLCVLDEKWPPTYLQVYCDGRIDATMESDPRRRPRRGTAPYSSRGRRHRPRRMARAINLRGADASRRRFRASIFESARRIGRGIERVSVRSGYLSQAPHPKDVLPYLSREVGLLTSLQILRGFNITAGGSEKD
jgi:nitroimidazol reductase NimA-like FMN-containing flavoprotein (pyridoxamine 5'-phosphate oxidase superfamily)